jgi:hypothetical protein
MRGSKYQPRRVPGVWQRLPYGPTPARPGRAQAREARPRRWWPALSGLGGASAVLALALTGWRGV